MYPHTLWSKGDDDTVRAMFADGKTAVEIAAVLNRTPAAVRQRRKTLGLPAKYSRWAKVKKQKAQPQKPRVVRCIPDINILKPKNGNMDSSGALARLLEFWDAA